MAKSKYFISQNQIDRIIQFYKKAYNSEIERVRFRFDEQGSYHDKVRFDVEGIEYGIIITPYRGTGTYSHRVTVSHYASGLMVLQDTLSIWDDDIYIISRVLPGAALHAQMDQTDEQKRIVELEDRVQQLENELEHIRPSGAAAPKRKRGEQPKFTAEEVEKIREAKEAKVPIKQIAKEYGCARGTIYAALADNYRVRQ